MDKFVSNLNKCLVLSGVLTLGAGVYYLFCWGSPGSAGSLLQASALFLGAGGVSASIDRYREKTVKKEHERAEIDFLNHRLSSEKLRVEHYRLEKINQLYGGEQEDLNKKVKEAHDRFEEIYGLIEEKFPVKGRM